MLANSAGWHAVSCFPHAILNIPSVPEGEREERQCPAVCHHLPCVQDTACQQQADAPGSVILLRLFTAPTGVCSTNTFCSPRGISAFQLPRCKKQQMKNDLPTNQYWFWSWLLFTCDPTSISDQTTERLVSQLSLTWNTVISNSSRLTTAALFTKEKQQRKSWLSIFGPNRS